MYSSEPWQLTVVRAQGVLALRPEKSWRPIVSVSLVETGYTHETRLACDGRNPNMKTLLILRDVDHNSNLNIDIWHKASVKKKARKHFLLASANVSLGELMRRQGGPNSDMTLDLIKRQPPRKRAQGPKSHKSNTLTLVLRLRAPLLEGPSGSSRSTVASRHGCATSEDSLLETTPDLVNSPLETLSNPEISLAEISANTATTEVSFDASITSGCNRRRPHRPTLRPFRVDSSESETSCGDLSCPPTHQPVEDLAAFSFDSNMDTTFDFGMQPMTDEGIDPSCMASILPQHAGETVETDTSKRSLSLMETIMNWFSPYRKMSLPDCDFDQVLGRLLTEWYTIGASLLATAALNVAIYGYSAPTLVANNGLALRTVMVGSIASGIGLAVDVWFLILYNGLDAVQFQHRARGVDSTYFFFCLTCRLPTLCLFIAVCTLLLFLLAVAWSAWRTAVLVMCCAAGILLTLQYLVYGSRWIVELCDQVMRHVVSAVKHLFKSPQVDTTISPASTPIPQPTAAAATS